MQTANATAATADEENACSLTRKTEVALVCALFLVCLSGIFGNSATLVTIGLTRSLHTVPNVYIANLAVVGLMICLVAAPSTAVGYMTPIPDNICRFMAYPNFTLMVVLLYSIALVAINRFVLVVKSRELYARLYSRRNVAFSIAATWAVGLALGSPPYLGFGNVGYNRKFGSCFVLEDDPASRMFLQMIGVGCCFVPTFVITIYCYFRITMTFIRSRERVKPAITTNPPVAVASTSAKPATIATVLRLPGIYDDRTKPRPKETTADGIGLEVKSERTSKLYGDRKRSILPVAGRIYPVNRASMAVLKRVLAVWAVFVVCWVPFTVLVILNRHERVTALTMHVAFVFSQSNSALNPVVYFGIGREFRHASRALLQKWRRRI